MIMGMIIGMLFRLLSRFWLSIVVVMFYVMVIMMIWKYISEVEVLFRCLVARVRNLSVLCKVMFLMRMV